MSVYQDSHAFHHRLRSFTPSSRLATVLAVVLIVVLGIHSFSRTESLPIQLQENLKKSTLDALGSGPSFPPAPAKPLYGSNYGSEYTLEDFERLPQKYHRIAFASHFVWHFDVYLSLAGTIQRTISLAQPTHSGGHEKHTKGSVVVYKGDENQFGRGFGSVVQKIGLLEGVEMREEGRLLEDLERGSKEERIDMLVLGTCEMEYVLFSLCDRFWR